MSERLRLVATIVLIVLFGAMVVASFLVHSQVWLLFSIGYFLLSFAVFMIAYWRWLGGDKGKK